MKKVESNVKKTKGGAKRNRRKAKELKGFSCNIGKLKNNFCKPNRDCRGQNSEELILSYLGKF